MLAIDTPARAPFTYLPFSFLQRQLIHTPYTKSPINYVKNMVSDCC